jgi:hypothetical protein
VEPSGEVNAAHRDLGRSGMSIGINVSALPDGTLTYGVILTGSAKGIGRGCLDFSFHVTRQ